MSNRTTIMPKGFAAMKSPTMTPSKKVMTWKELEQATASAKKNRGGSVGNCGISSRQTPPRRSLPHRNSIATPSSMTKTPTVLSPSEDLAYQEARRKRLAKKAHLLGNRGKGTGNISPDLVTPKGNISLKTPMSTINSQHRRPVRNSVGVLLMTPSPTYIKTGGKLSFSAEKTSSVKNTSRRGSAAKATPLESNENRRSSAKRDQVKTPPRAKSSPSAKVAMRSISSLHPVAKASPLAKSSPAGKVSSLKDVKTKSRATSTLRQRQSMSGKSGGGSRNSTRTPIRKRANSTPKARHSSENGTPQGRTPLKPLPLSLQRDKENRTKSKSPIRSTGTRRNLDKRTARLLYSDNFAIEIMKFRQGKRYLNNGTNHEGEPNLFMRGHEKNNGVAIFVRKRPIFEYELDRGEFDVVSIDGSTRYDSDQVIIHNAQMHPDMRQMFVKNISFPCSAAFDEHCTNDNLYRHVAKPLVRSVAGIGSGIATLVMYGQTGSGKTHTMSGIEERAAHDLFNAISDSGQVKLQFVELSGKVVKDLLDSKIPDVRIVDQEDGSVRLLNALSVEATSPKELSRLISKAKGRRATEATDVNGVSSRSHAVCQITVTNVEGERGVFTLIDCAGSERRNDSLYHSSERQKESTEINASLFALKECIRARSQQKAHVPYRSSSLTRILRETLEQKGSKLCIVATCAPNATDTEHTLETLKTVTSLVGTEGIELEKEGSTSPRGSEITSVEGKLVNPKQWSHEELVAWMGKKKLLPKSKSIPASMDGRFIMRMSKLQFRTIVYDESESAKSETLFTALRAESDRVDKAKFKQRMMNVE